jgi:hypothetical protein
VAHQLSALTESHLHDFAQQRRIDHHRRLMRHHANHRAVDPRRGIETLGRHRQHAFHGIAVLQHDTQAAVVRGRRPGHHPINDFLLKHEVLVLNQVHTVQQVKQDRG